MMRILSSPIEKGSNFDKSQQEPTFLCRIFYCWL